MSKELRDMVQRRK